MEAFAEAMCIDLMARCKSARKPAKYTFEQCMQIVSSVNGGPGSDAWTNANMGLLGPSTRSASCTLEEVLPYQPWGPSWR